EARVQTGNTAEQRRLADTALHYRYCSAFLHGLCQNRSLAAGNDKMGDEVKVVVRGSKESGGNCFDCRQAFML
ncbi:MAG: hypothetical protein ACI9DC_005403, partial [Gammaproteobacteria bacterium]